MDREQSPHVHTAPLGGSDVYFLQKWKAVTQSCHSELSPTLTHWQSQLLHELSGEEGAVMSAVGWALGSRDKLALATTALY